MASALGTAADCFERFQRVQEILDRNKCVGCAGLGLRTAFLLTRTASQAADIRDKCKPRVEEVRAPVLHVCGAQLRLSGSSHLLSVVTPLPRTAHLVVCSPEALQHNVVLIRELNSNIARIVQLYRDLSARCDSERCTPPSTHRLTRCSCLAHGACVARCRCHSFDTATQEAIRA